MSSVKERITKKAHSDPRVTIDTIHSELIKNMEQSAKSDYYLDNGLLLNEYYSGNTNKVKSTKGVLGYFKEEIKDNEIETNIIGNYMMNIDDRYIIDDNQNNTLSGKCKICNLSMSMVLVSSELICRSCGYTETIIINSDKTSYKDPPREASYFAYKRINHFNEWLAQFQAKETTEISEEVYTNIYNMGNMLIIFIIS